MLHFIIFIVFLSTSRLCVRETDAYRSCSGAQRDRAGIRGGEFKGIEITQINIYDLMMLFKMIFILLIMLPLFCCIYHILGITLTTLTIYIYILNK